MQWGGSGVFLLAMVIAVVGAVLPSVLSARDRRENSRGEDRFSSRVRILGSPASKVGEQTQTIRVRGEKPAEQIKAEFEQITQFWAQKRTRRKKRVLVQNIVLLLSLFGFFVLIGLWLMQLVSPQYVLIPFGVGVLTLSLGAYWGRRDRLLDEVCKQQLSHLRELYNREKASLRAQSVRRIQPAGSLRAVGSKPKKPRGRNTQRGPRISRR